MPFRFDVTDLADLRRQERARRARGRDRVRRLVLRGRRDLSPRLAREDRAASRRALGHVRAGAPPQRATATVVDRDRSTKRRRRRGHVPRRVEDRRRRRRDGRDAHVRAGFGARVGPADGDADDVDRATAALVDSKILISTELDHARSSSARQPSTATRRRSASARPLRRRERLLPQRQARQAQGHLQPPGPRRRRRGTARSSAVLPHREAEGDGHRTRTARRTTRRRRSCSTRAIGSACSCSTRPA